MTTTEATFGVFCPGVLEVLSIGKGDLKLTIDDSNPEDQERARKLIEEMLRKGYAIYVETEHGPIRVRQFNADTMTYVIADEPEPAADAEMAGAEPVKPEKRAPRKSRTRGIAIAGSIATAVGRTAGG